MRHCGGPYDCDLLNLIGSQRRARDVTEGYRIFGRESALLLQGSRGAARKQIKERDGFNKVLAKTLWNGDERGCIPTETAVTTTTLTRPLNHPTLMRF